MLINSASVPFIVEQIESLRPAPGEVVMLLFAEQDVPDIPALVEALNEKGILFFGGIFPGLLYGKRHVKAGCILKKFKFLMPPFCVTGIASAQFNGLPPSGSADHLKKGTAIVLLDGLTPNLYLFLENLNNLLGYPCDFIGGGAGSISLQQQPCIFCNEGFFADAGVVCVLEQQISLGVRHGWEHLAGPLVATQTDGNTILQLNWTKAIEVYNDIVEKDCGIKLDQNNFAGIAQGYPFGILREKQDDIVRDPLAFDENGSIICIGEVPPNTVLHVLKGRPDKLLSAARIAIGESSGGLNGAVRTEGTFVADCITRTLFLDDQFADELSIIREGTIITSDEQEPFGILSLGEIASYGDGLLELFNKTIVIGTFY